MSLLTKKNGYLFRKLQNNFEKIQIFILYILSIPCSFVILQLLKLIFCYHGGRKGIKKWEKIVG